MSNNFLFENQQAVVTTNFDFGSDTLEPSFNPYLVVHSTSSGFGVGNPVDTINKFIRDQQIVAVDKSVSSVWGKGVAIQKSFKFYVDNNLQQIDSVVKTIIKTALIKPADTSILLKPERFEKRDINCTTRRIKSLKPVSQFKYCSWVLPAIKDVSFKVSHHSVNLYGESGIRPDYRYFTSVDFTFNGERANTTADFVDPINFDLIKRRLVPVSLSNNIDAGKKQRVLDFSQRLYWGYSVNRFVIGGSVLLPNGDNDIRPPEAKVHPDYEVFRIVNIVNIVTLPNRDVVDFGDFTISIDVDSFCWVANFNIIGQRSYDLVKPNGRNLTQLEVNINDVKFSLFVATVGRSQVVGKSQFKAVAYSPLKLLSYPYAHKRSFNQTVSKTASQLITDELTGTGLTLDWGSPDWTIPSNIHSYQDKTPMGALLEVVNAAGGVIQPSPDGNVVKVRPRFPTSPWQWDTATLDHTISINQFISVEDSNVPKDNPERVFVYGESNSGAGGRVTKLGTSGAKLLPDVVNKYITDGVVVQERGRIELAKNSYLNEVSMTTYVDTSVGIFLPLELVEFTEPDGSKWRGQVVATSIACKRVGTALLQNIKVLRYYE